MTTFEENAEQFGIGAPEEDYNEDIYAPVRLSNSTRRMMTPTEMAQDRVNTYSPTGRMMREQEMLRQKELLEIDRLEDEAYAREIEKRAKAAAWNDKVKAQEHGSAVSSMLLDLDPTQSDYLSKVDQALSKYPLAKLDPQIGSLLESRQAVYNVAKEERDKAEAAQLRQTERLENREDNQKFQMDSARIARDEQLRTNIELKVADMSAEGQNAYKKLLSENKTPLEAFQAARIEDKGVVTLKDANMANRLVQNYDRQIAQARKAIDEINSDLTAGEADKAARRSVHETTISNLTTDRELEAAVVDSYWESKGGRPKPKNVADQPGPTVPQGDTPRSGAAPAADALTPSVDPQKIRAAVDWAKANPDDPRSKVIFDRVKGLKNDAL